MNEFLRGHYTFEIMTRPKLSTPEVRRRYRKQNV
jgi:hypothetical protein